MVFKKVPTGASREKNLKEKGDPCIKSKKKRSNTRNRGRQKVAFSSPAGGDTRGKVFKRPQMGEKKKGFCTRGEEWVRKKGHRVRAMVIRWGRGNGKLLSKSMTFHSKKKGWPTKGKRERPTGPCNRKEKKKAVAGQLAA